MLPAGTRSTGDRATLTFAVGDILDLPAGAYDAVLCRGVLNDLLDDDRRERAFAAFARTLRPGGVLVLDVREWEASLERKAREPFFRKSVDTDSEPAPPIGWLPSRL